MEVSSSLSWFQVPSYAFVTEHDDACDTVDVSYALFYPFNYGKVEVNPAIVFLTTQSNIISDNWL